ncbi:MAG: sulfur carrier protein ThiS [Clostridium perfringens]|nr:sulfur carrier protein ThiS [Clostridium perfringens]
MIINGKDYKISECSTISDILEKLNINKEKVVVEVNLNIISKDEYDSFIVKENDSLEVLSFVGGG